MRCTRLIRAVVVAAALALASMSAHAVLTPTWDNASTDNSTSDFDDGTLTFARTFAGCIEIVNEEGGYYHDHGDGANQFNMAVRVNNVWSVVYTAPTLGDEEENPLSDVPVVAFNAGLVDAVRLYSSSFVDQFFHSVEDGMQFDLTSGGDCGVLSPVPADNPTALILLVTLLLGLGAWQLAIRQTNA